jgi:hypothetical protein
VITLESLKEQLVASENELEQAKSHVYRCDGATQLLKHLIQQAETPEKPETKESTEIPAAE